MYGKNDAKDDEHTHTHRHTHTHIYIYIYTQWRKNMIPCWFCMFPHWQINDLSIILMVSVVWTLRDRITTTTTKSKNAFQKSYTSDKVAQTDTFVLKRARYEHSIFSALVWLVPGAEVKLERVWNVSRLMWSQRRSASEKTRSFSRKKRQRQQLWMFFVYLLRYRANFDTTNIYIYIFIYIDYLYYIQKNLLFNFNLV